MRSVLTGLVLLTTLVVFAGEAVAMHVRTSIAIAAWSDDGASVLLRIDDGGPEGGGALRYRLLSAGAPTDATTTVSSNFSDGSREVETVSAESRRSALAALVTTLEAKGFRGVSTDGRTLRLPPPADGTPVVVEAAVNGAAKHGSTTGLRVVVEGAEVRVESAGRTIARTRCLSAPYEAEKSYRTTAILSPSGRLMVVISSSAVLGIDSVCGTFASSSGRPAELRPVESSRLQGQP